ncbi:histidinol dehydrogenase [Candidatus Poribacteria bacterium]|nr:histidinol dehydrogenase [Candidatus Poribacteria bacterium]
MLPTITFPSPEAERFLARMSQRGGFGDRSLLSSVREIIARVRLDGDDACREFTRMFDSPDAPNELRVSIEDMERAYSHVTDAFLDAVRLAIGNIRSFHEKQLSRSWMMTEPDGSLLGQMVFPLRRVGVYCPPTLFSSLMMNAIPAQVAGVSEIALAAPPQRTGGVHPGMLVTARECGIEEVYACAGVPAIAAMAYGTRSIPRVDKVVGPGGDYVQLAKREVVGIVDIDKLAGPSEVLVIADHTATPAYVAADLISQAEHGARSSAVLVTTSKALAESVCEELRSQVETLPRQEEIRGSFESFGACLVVSDIDAAIGIANEVAPEHVEVLTRDPMPVAVRIRNAGAVFVGESTPEAVGDYVAGPSHVLPTGGTARFYSSLCVADFLKTTNLLAYTPQALDRVTDAIVALAHAEGLEGHAASATIRRRNQNPPT